jgi:hypothetical protein
MSFDMVVFIVGLVVGSFMIIIVSLVYFKNQKFGTGGTVLSVLGVVLIGLFLWVRIKIVITGVAEIEADLRQTQIAIQDIQAQRDSIERELSGISAALESLPARGESAGQINILKQKVFSIRQSNQQIHDKVALAQRNTIAVNEKFLKIVKPPSR